MQGTVARFTTALGTAVVGAGIAAAGAFATFAVASARAADAVGDAADRAGVAVESLSRLKYAASQSDVEFGALTQGIKKWQITLSQAASGEKAAADALALIGLKAADLKNLSLEGQLGKIADQFQRIADPADRTRVAVELFGRSGEQLVPLLVRGGDALKEFTDKADRLGITLDGKTTQSIDRYQKAWQTLIDTLTSSSARAAGRVAAAILGPQNDDELLESLIKRRDAIQKAIEGSIFGAASNQTAALAGLNKQIDETFKRIFDKANQEARNPKSPLKVPIDTSATDKLMAQLEQVRVSESLLKDPLIEWEKQTRTSAERVANEFAEFQANLELLVQHGTISGGEAQKRTSERLDDILQPIQISVSRLAVPLTAAQEKAKEFTDTLRTGLENAARAGEITGKSILRNLLAAFESKILYTAIDKFANYISNSIAKASSTSGGGSGFLGGLVGAFLGHAAGGGQFSGATVVGEDGPELVTGRGQVLNRRQMAFAGGGAGPSVVFGDTNINVQGDSDPKRTAEYIEARLAQNNKKQLEQVSRVLKNNGFGELR